MAQWRWRWFSRHTAYPVNAYPPPEQIPSAERQRRLYVEAVKEIDHLRKMVASENIIAKEYKHDRDDLQGELKQSRRKVKLLTVREHQRKLSKSAAAFASVSGVIMTITYEAFKVWGFPFARGNKAVIEFWHHEAVFAALTAILTWLLAEIYKQANTNWIGFGGGWIVWWIVKKYGIKKALKFD